MTKARDKQWTAKLDRQEWLTVENAITRTGMGTRWEFLLFVSDVVSRGILDDEALKYRIERIEE